MTRFPFEVWMDGRLRYRAASRSRARSLALGYWHQHPESSRYEIADTKQHPEGITIEKCRRAAAPVAA